MKTETFAVHSLPLSGIRMVDASAGTGKTYSIALLVIRLILEKDMDIRSVLVVTFTRAATREIQGRIQDFLMELNACCDDPAQIEDSPLHACLSPDAEMRAQQQKKITEALLFIDEAPIHTIHAFCQKMLSTHPFETGNLFSPVMLEDNTDLHARFINSRWRKLFETLPSELFSCITPVVGKRGDIAPLVSALLSEQHIEFPPDVDPEAALAAYEKRMADFDAREEALAADSVVWEELFEVLEEICGEYSPKSPPKYIQNLTAAVNMADVKKEVFTQAGDVKKLIKKKEKLCSTAVIGALISIHGEKTACTEEFDSLCRQAAQRLACILAQEAAEDIRAYKKKNSLLEFDDLIANLHTALFSDSGQNTAQAAAMSREYSALFIDEFQDTDRKQFEILHALFSDKPSFYIGDPKQSIYGWRGADLDTYFSVRSTKAHAVYSMKECFRSTSELTRAFNTFFSASSSFFAHDELTYTPVEGKNRENEKKHTPLTIYRGGSTKDDLIDTAAEVVTAFFSENRDESLQNSAVLVRSHREAGQMKQALAHRGVPAVTIDESSLYATAGAEELKSFLEALFFQEDRRIRRALLSHLAGLRAQDLAAMKEGEYESHMRRFAAYGEIWKKRGIAAALKACISEYGLRERVFEDRTIMEGERLFADLMHLLDCMVCETVKNGLSTEEQLLFLQKQTARESRQKRRVENDSNSLQIVTIHKSKGLTYDHVFCPFLNVSASRPPGPLTLIPKNGGHSFVTTDEDTQFIEKESLRENRRLTYVAMTRARFSCTLCIAKKGK
ncbi:MAG: UvrD-helicase domain-containing protein, partial [Fibrobacterota bacterium]